MSRQSTTGLHATGADPLLGRVINDRYKVVEQIGEGGMGRVYKALQAPLDRVVALKVLRVAGGRDLNLSKRFSLEAAVTAKLTHPNTITLYDYGATPDGIFFIAMEYLNGRNLQDVLKQEGPLAQDRVIHIAQQICRSLSEAHALGIIHRDLKPSNVMLLSQPDDHDFAKVLDFGLVKFFAGENPQGGVTDLGTFVGSPDYMSPEQARNRQPDQRADIYSLGVVLYQMLTGHPPFVAESSMDVILKHLLEAPVPPRVARPDLEIAPALEEIVLRCLSKEREDRHQSMDEVLTQLKLARSGSMGLAPPAAAPLHQPPSSGRTQTVSGRTQTVSGRTQTAANPAPTPHPEMRTPAPADPFGEEVDAQLVSRHEAVTAGVISLSIEQTSPPPADPSEPRSVLSRGWIVAFRALHERSQAGELNALESARYDRERATLFNALLTAQRLTLKPGACLRRSMRLATELPVELEGGPEPVSTRTVDLTAGGFSVLLPGPLRVGDRVDFTIGLRIGLVSGQARVANLQRKGKPYRIGFKFEDLPSAEASLVDLEVLNGVLSMVDRQRRMEG
jgi:serine/threonine protein kinase